MGCIDRCVINAELLKLLSQLLFHPLDLYRHIRSHTWVPQLHFVAARMRTGQNNFCITADLPTHQSRISRACPDPLVNLLIQHLQNVGLTETWLRILIILRISSNDLKGPENIWIWNCSTVDTLLCVVWMGWTLFAFLFHFYIKIYWLESRPTFALM